MKSLSNCVQEFLDYHSRNFFPNHSTTETRRPRTSRFNSIPSAATEIEDEDPSGFSKFSKSSFSFVYFLDLFVITPPIEHFLDVSSRLRREQFFKVIYSFKKKTRSIFIP
jgi:hypothetical protein